MKKDKNTERLNRINEERVQILSATRESVLKSKDKINEKIDSYISDNFDYNETIANIKDIISNLVAEASKANSEEEIIKLRNRINYYVKKLKAELKKRNVTEEEFNRIYSGITDVRKNIATLVRYEKRKHNIDRINELNNMYETLTDEELRELRKLLNNERSYNTRIIKKLNNKEELTRKRPVLIEPSNESEGSLNYTELGSRETGEEKKSIYVRGYKIYDLPKDEYDNLVKVIEQSIINRNSFDSEFEEIKKLIGMDCETTERSENGLELCDPDLKCEGSGQEGNLAKNNEQLIPVYDAGQPDIKPKRSIFSDEREIFEDYFAGRITPEEFFNIRTSSYMNTFYTKNPHKYDGNIFTNFINLIRNIPIYCENKKVLKYAILQYSCYYRGEDLRGFIDYSMKRNSIFYALKAAFNSKKISDEEKELLNDPEKCGKWILTYSKVR